MTITKHSKIKEFVNKKNIDKILNINDSFKKLGAWTIEKYASSGVNVKDFSEIGKIAVNIFLKHIEKLGFEVEYDNQKEEKVGGAEKINEDNLKIVPLDVRPIIQSGSDPFGEIMQAIKFLKEDETLKIINIFVPIPLINVLKGKGFKSWTNSISDKEHHTFFTKVDLSVNSNLEKKEATEGSFDDKLASFGDKVKEIEVRHLEMPEPMVTILEELEVLPDTHVLLVNHKKVPQFLLPELKTRNYQWMYKDIEPGYLLFIVFK
ncbi:MAG TPA: hypothetical protein DEO36_10320 [Flavobacteriaceae bacterium]|jgi:uncharacterized protein (DUF2249 family)|nr:hypothetical protein [Flavobacteriaceae bacterium]